MPLSPGTRLGIYEIAAQIGEGGMGQVYRGRDTRLNRDVAIKILPDVFVYDAERRARFEREARTLAQLNHPNIAIVHGLEQTGDLHALVMELVSGEDLLQRLARGALPLDEALPIARQIAEALKAAHEQGIVHRDLKPANIKVRPDGTVKVLDFGLAKAVEPSPIGQGFSPAAPAGQAGAEAPAYAPVSQAPTITTPAMMTGAGMILGTAAYMSPEQARGKPVDKRADIWSFGCVLYELLTGRRAFPGDEVADTLASVLKSEPDWRALPSNLPPAIRALVERCLEKNAHQRIADISTALFLITDPTLGALPSLGTAPREAWRRVVPWAAATALAAGLAIVAFVHFREQPPVPESVRFQIVAPGRLFGLSLSPNGRSLALVVQGEDGQVHVQVRSFETLEPRILSGTEGAAGLFWSSDSQFIGFASGGKLKKVSAAGGPTQSLCDLPGNFRGGAWGPDGSIVFGALGRGLMRVSEAGGVPTDLTILDSSKQEADHRSPSFLPDGRHFVYVGGKPGSGRIYLGSLDNTPEQQTARPLTSSEFPNSAAYSPSPNGGGYLLFGREGSLVALPFDAKRLEITGAAFPIAEGLGSGVGSYSASTTGSLAIRASSGAGIKSQLQWFGRDGNLLGQVGPPGPYESVQLSPDGKTLVVDQVDARGAAEHLWSADPARGVFSRVNPGEVRDYAGGAVAPDGRVAFTYVSADAAGDVYVRPANGAGAPEPLVKSATLKHPNHWSLDGRFVIYDDHTTQRMDLWIVPMTGERTPIPFLVTPADETDANFSPDTRWIAYSSDESGRREVYVRGFTPDRPPLAGIGKWQISTAGGAKPRWGRDGKELYYMASDGMLTAVPVASTASTFAVGVAVPLFEASTRGYFPYDVAADGRFLLNTATATTDASPITVVLNWAAGLK